MKSRPENDPVPNTPQTNWPPAPQQLQLPNGLTIHAVTSYPSRLTEIRLVARGGFVSPAHLQDCASATFAMISANGALRDALAANGGAIASRIEPDGAVLELSLVGTDLYPMLNALTVAVAATIDPRAHRVGSEKDRRRSRQATALDAADLPLDALPALLYPKGSAYARSLVAPHTVDAIGAVTPHAVSEWRRRYLSPSQLSAIVVTSLGSAELNALLSVTFGRWEAGASDEANEAGAIPSSPALPQELRLVLVEQDWTHQNRITWSCLVNLRSTADNARLLLADALASGMFTSRLNLKSRERAGWTYGVRGRIFRTRHHALWMITSSVQVEYTATAMTAIVDELSQLSERNSISDAELSRAKRWLTASLLGRYETCAATADQLANSVLFRFPGSYQNLIAELEPIDPRELAGFYAHLREDCPSAWLLVGGPGNLRQFANLSRG